MDKEWLASGSIFFRNCFSFRWGLAWRGIYDTPLCKESSTLQYLVFSIFRYALANVMKDASVQELTSWRVDERVNVHP
jgi:hypothetical protein